MIMVPGHPNKLRYIPVNNRRIKTTNPAAAKDDNLFFPLSLGNLEVFENEHDGTRDEDR